MKYILLLACLAAFCGCTTTVCNDACKAAKHSHLVTTDPENDSLGSTSR